MAMYSLDSLSLASQLSEDSWRRLKFIVISSTRALGLALADVVGDHVLTISELAQSAAFSLLELSSSGSLVFFFFFFFFSTHES